ncbi:unnamed protein product [Musa banksii]
MKLDYISSYLQRCYCCQLRPMKSPEANYRCFIYINTS